MREIRMSGLMRGRATALPTLPLICCSLLASSASAGYPPETERLHPRFDPY